MELKAEKRTVFGKATVNLRKQGLIPAELYGRGMENLHLVLPSGEFNKVFKATGTSTVITLLVENEKHSVLVHDVARNYLRGEVDHIDFYKVKAGQKIRTRVPILFQGEAPAIKIAGGVLNTAMSDIEVEAAAEHLPREITVSLEGLAEIGQNLYVKDLILPKNVSIHVDSDTVIASVSEPRAEEIAAPAQTVDVSEVKVESEEKKAERAAKKESEE